MADRVVVMNQGVIEQIGTPQEIYREPASAFVADFVGKVNVISAVAESNGRYRVGGLVLDAAAGSKPVAVGTAVRLYLRPEDVVINGAAGGLANGARGNVTKVEFLGAFCHVTADLAEAPGQALLINISRHSIDEMSLVEGSVLQLALPADCMRLLA